MSLNFTSKDMEDAKLMADAIYSEFLRDFEKNFNKPDKELSNALAYKAMPEESKKALRENDPETYRLVQKKYGGV